MAWFRFLFGARAPIVETLALTDTFSASFREDRVNSRSSESPLFATLDRQTQVESALRILPGLAAVTVVRSGAKGISYYPADHAANLWYASSQLSKSLTVQTFDWDVTLEGLAGPQPLLQVSSKGASCVNKLGRGTLWPG